MNYQKLKGEIRGKYGTQDAFAAAMGISVCSLNKKLNGTAEWTASNIRKAIELLSIPTQDIPLYFFCFES